LRPLLWKTWPPAAKGSLWALTAGSPLFALRERLNAKKTKAGALHGPVHLLCY
jgi:hypothetical protein